MVSSGDHALDAAAWDGLPPGAPDDLVNEGRGHRWLHKWCRIARHGETRSETRVRRWACNGRTSLSTSIRTSSTEGFNKRSISRLPGERTNNPPKKLWVFFRALRYLKLDHQFINYQAGNTVMTPLGSQLSVDSSDNLLSCGSRALLPL
ncbi:hypothetical protein EVAR_8313_1 [Eumeta japonica]|uniref:Uncharacterized protein n=1 Tax=Eumeta variegata TaxID=151549 RepID=A0A4C1VD65_EUMVA|nr:hypothetical protein EVAR_8313_1 [Eumeta japonica]